MAPGQGSPGGPTAKAAPAASRTPAGADDGSVVDTSRSRAAPRQRPRVDARDTPAPAPPPRTADAVSPAWRSLAEAQAWVGGADAPPRLDTAPPRLDTAPPRLDTAPPPDQPVSPPAPAVGPSVHIGVVEVRIAPPAPTTPPPAARAPAGVPAARPALAMRHGWRRGLGRG